MSSSFDPFEMDGYTGAGTKDLPPFWTLPLKDKERVLEWLKQECQDLAREAEARIHNQRINLAAFRGLHYRNQDPKRSDETDNRPTSRKTPRLMINHLYDLTEDEVSMLTEFRPSLTVDAEDEDDWEDRIDAKIAQEVLDQDFDQIEIDSILPELHRHKRILGEVYLGNLWDKHAGDIHPDYKTLLEKEGQTKIPLLDDNGEQLRSESGDLLFYDQVVRKGALTAKLFFAWEVFMQRKRKAADVEHILFYEVMPVDEVKADHPEQAKDITQGDALVYNSETFDFEKRDGQCIVWHFYHKTTRFLEKGRYVKFTNDVILTNEDNRYIVDGRAVFPLDRLTDIDVPGILNGVSSYENAKMLQKVINNLNTMFLRNVILGAHPKWMVPGMGNVKVSDLGNDATVVTYMGPSEPRLAQADPMVQSIFNWEKDLTIQLAKMMSRHPVSQGEPPKGVTAAVALQFLDELENKRSNITVNKANNFLKRIGRKRLAFHGCFIDDSDDRLKDFIGKKKAALYKDLFKMQNLAKPYRVRVQNVSALPRQKGARIQAIFDYKEKFPDLVSSEQAVDLLELGQLKRFQSIATASIQAAERENEEIARFGKCDAPQVWQQHITHYRIHLRDLNDYGYTNAMPQQLQSVIIDHVTATEMYMAEIARTNPAYLATILAEFPAFPIFYEPPVPLIPPQPEGALPPEEEIPGEDMPPEPEPLPPAEIPPGAENQMPYGDVA